MPASHGSLLFQIISFTYIISTTKGDPSWPLGYTFLSSVFHLMIPPTLRARRLILLPGSKGKKKKKKEELRTKTSQIQCDNREQYNPGSKPCVKKMKREESHPRTLTPRQPSLLFYHHSPTEHRSYVGCYVGWCPSKSI